MIGNFLYSIFTMAVTRTGSLLIMILLVIIVGILMIPKEFFSGLYAGSKEKLSDLNQHLDQKKQERQIEQERRAEEERQRKIEELQQLEIQAEQERQRQIEEERKAQKELEIQENLRKQEIDREIRGKSKAFIHLTDKEIYGKDETDEKPAEPGRYEFSQHISLYDDFSNNVQETHDVQEQTTQADTVDEPKTLRPAKRSLQYRLPRPYDSFLETSASNSSNVNKTSAAVKAEKVIDILKNFGINAELLNTYIGPSVTKFEIKPDSSVKISRIMNIADNIKMELAAKDIRIEAPIPGRSAVGIEIPNVEPVPVKMLDLMKNMPNQRSGDDKNDYLMFALGKDLMGKAVYCDLAKMPHLLIAGATGSGKSVCINSIIISLLMRTNPNDVKLVLVDPKKVEFTSYKDIPHLLWPIIDDATMASNMLKKVVVIMEERYEAFAAVGVRNISGFNSYVSRYNSSKKSDQAPMEKLPYMVVIIDELADLMAIAGKEVEMSIQRITQLARASGIHLIVATQRPSTDVITGLIKSNIPSRISFAVASSIDSRTILDQTGAERLLGNGDMLYYPQGETAPIRLQGVYVTDSEINKVTRYARQQCKPEYEDSYYEFLTNSTGTSVMSANSVNADSMDSLYDDVVEFVKLQQKASTSLLQRRFGIGYNRAARLIDTLEDRGVVGPANGSKPREVYLKPDDEE
ncbi:MAG: DUF87 domain-containing protein [Erysipelotrichaceae bacterium]|nr:DUF87 domain-containing protein [Erysipelotrichaceae bacterium]